MRLINTIEVSPYEYEPGEYPDGLSPIYKDVWLFDITTVSDNALIKILKNKLNGIDLPDFHEQVIALSGGIALEDNNIFYITPSCCGDLGAIHDWERMIEEQTTSWQKLWIGHPWIYYRKNDSHFEFSDYTEVGPDSLDHLQMLVTVPSSDLQHELSKIRAEQYAFCERIEKALNDMGIQHAAEIARLMTANL